MLIRTHTRTHARTHTMTVQSSVAMDAVRWTTVPLGTPLNSSFLSALRSAARGDLVVPRTRLQLGNQEFRVAGLVAWNSLPLDIRSAPTLLTFKNMLKTHLFSRSYFND